MYEIDCDEVLNDLEAFLDGELPGDRAATVGQHLDACSPCMARGDFRQRLRAIIGEKCGRAVVLPPNLEERVRRAVRGRSL